MKLIALSIILTASLAAAQDVPIASPAKPPPPGGKPPPPRGSPPPQGGAPENPRSSLFGVGGGWPTASPTWASSAAPYPTAEWSSSSSVTKVVVSSKAANVTGSKTGSVIKGSATTTFSTVVPSGTLVNEGKSWGAQLGGMGIVAGGLAVLGLL